MIGDRLVLYNIPVKRVLNRTRLTGAVKAITLFLMLAVSMVCAENRLVTKNFKWRIVETAHFHIYYYPWEEALVPRVAEILEESYARVTKDLDIPVEKKTPFFLFMNHNEFEQNSIVDLGEGTGGVTEAFKHRLLIFNDGSRSWLKHVIPHEFAHVVEFRALFDDAFFVRFFRLAKFAVYPLWFMEGLAEYESFVGAEDMEMDMVVNDAATSGFLPPLENLHFFSHLKPHEITLAYKSGESAIRFMAEEYGRDKPGKLLKTLRDRFDVSSGLNDILGLGLQSFSKKWQEHIREKAAAQMEGKKEPWEYGGALTKNTDALPDFNTDAVFSPDGKRMAYFSDRDGEASVYLADLPSPPQPPSPSPSIPLPRGEGGRRPGEGGGVGWGEGEAFSHTRLNPKRIARGRSSKAEYLHAGHLAFSADGQWLSFAGEKKQRDYLFLYSPQKGSLKRVKVEGLETVRTPIVAGDKIIFGAMKDGVFQIARCDLKGKNPTFLTSVVEDHSDFAVSPDGKTLVFSREDTGAQRDLYRMDLQTLAVNRLTNLKGNEIRPALAPNGRLFFIADGEGARNLYVMAQELEPPQRLTDITTAIHSAAISPDGNKVLFTAYRKRSIDIYLADISTFGVREAAPSVKSPAPEPEVSISTPPSMFGSRPYRFKFTPDILVPFLAYSTQDGLLVASLFQGSEMLGNHQFQSLILYRSKPSNALDYQVSYTYRKWRPQFLFASARTSLALARSEGRITTQREDGHWVAISYPLSRFHSVELSGITSSLRSEFTGARAETRLLGAAVVRDTALGKWLTVTAGSRTRLAYERGLRILGGENEFENYFLDLQRFFSFRTDHTFALRFQGATSRGRTPFRFELPARGFGDDDFAKRSVAATTLEFRFPIVRDINYYMNWFFPDFFFKTFQGFVYLDNGFSWNSREEFQNLTSSDLRMGVGAGLRLYTFILQAFPFPFQFSYGRRLNPAGNHWDFSIGMGF